ncbi:MAG: YcxB family protein [Anaerotignum sp.]|nr:YcxB family protein [Anaerotignum sp.]
MEINFELTEEDFIKFNLYHMENSPSQKKLYLSLRFALPLLCAVPIYLIETGVFRQSGLSWLTISILFAAGWIFFYPKRHKHILRKQIKKLLHEGDNSSLFGKKTMLIDEKYIKIFDEHSSETILKNNIKSVKIYDDLILIYLSAITAHIIPIRNLDEATKKQLIKELD